MRRDVPREVFSITKSVTSTLVGIAIRDGDLRLDDRRRALRPAVARHRLGGVSRCATCSPTTAAASGRCSRDYADLLTARSRTRYAVGLPQQYAPGTRLGLQQRGDPGARGGAGGGDRDAGREVRPGAPVRAAGHDALELHHRPRRRRGGVLRAADRRASTSPGSARSTSARARSTARRLLDDELRAPRDRPALDRAQRCLRLPLVAQPSRPAARRDRPGRRAGPAAPARSPGSSRRPRPSSVYAALGFGGQVLLVDPTTRTMVIRIGAPRPGGRGGVRVRPRGERADGSAALTGGLTTSRARTAGAAAGSRRR